MNSKVEARKSYPVEMLKHLPLLREYLRLLKAKKRLYVSAGHLSRDLRISVDELIEEVNLIGIPCNANIDFAVNPLIDAIEIFLGFHKKNMAFLVGTGPMAEAVITQLHCSECGLQVLAAFDENVAGRKKLKGSDIEIFSIEKLKNLVERMHVNIGILASPAEKAQQHAGLMEESGIDVIWNLSGYPLKTAEHTITENTDMVYDLARIFRKIREKDSNNIF